MFITPFSLQNREMHDHMEYFMAGQNPPPMTSTENKPEVVYRWLITSLFIFLLIFLFSANFSICLLLMLQFNVQANLITLISHFYPPLYSKPLTPTTPTNKVLPFIKVIEIKSWMECRQEWSEVLKDCKYILTTRQYIKHRSVVI